ncbi:MAG: hypothetical protein HY559_06790 [Gammaproteobacteria bacterium]|nr:hypothetical protein [Gammaproteobacteria bacterium]
MKEIFFIPHSTLRIPHLTGAILLVSLLFLMAISILAVSGFDRRILDLKVAAQTGEQLVAFYQAENGLEEGENWIIAELYNESGFSSLKAERCFYDLTLPLKSARTRLPRDKGLFLLGNALQWTRENSCQEKNKASRFFVEYLGRSSEVPHPDYFRLTAMGMGRDLASSQVLRSHFKVVGGKGKRVAWSTVHDD